MPIELPEPIAAYIAAENHGDPKAVSRCFAKDGMVTDERETHRGQAAIGAWSAGTHSKYRHQIEPLRVSNGGGETVVTCRLTGDFPGSPVELEFAFRLAGGKVFALEIRR
jgi:hypothetical protein